MAFNLNSSDPTGSIEYLAECFEISGQDLIWKARPDTHFAMLRIARTWRSRYAGRKAGSIDSHGYMQVKIDGKLHLIHRLIWLMKTGFNAETIDHIDGNPLNNNIENLRDVPHSKNMRNQKKYRTNKSGIMGVHWLEQKKVWLVKLSNKHIGQYECFLDACAARKGRELDNSFHENHGGR